MTQENWMLFTAKYQPVIDVITAALDEAQMSAQDGENLLLFLAGMSAGIEQRSLLSNNWLEAVAAGWLVGAAMEEEQS